MTDLRRARPEVDYEPLLAGLTADRQAHSRAVGLKVKLASRLLPLPLREEAVAAGWLHDVGYAHPATGFHSIDGARWLTSLGFSAIARHLVAHHSLSVIEAGLRGIALAEFRAFEVEPSPMLERASEILLWADMTTGPTGLTVTVEERLKEVRARYGPDHVVTRFVDAAETELRQITGAVEAQIR